MTKWYRLIGVLISALLFFSNISVAFAKPTDYSKNWAEKEIEKWLSYQVAQTNENGNFKPSDPISRVDMAIMLNRLFNYQEKSDAKFSDIASDAIYAADVAKAVAAGNFTGNNGKFRPGDSITRQEAAVVFARAFTLAASSKNSLGKFSDSTKIADWSRDAANIMVGSGYMNGVPGGKFAPGNSITRAEAVKIVDNIVKDLKNKAGTYTGEVGGNLVVNAKDVKLQNMTIKGDLYLTEGIGSGEVTLDNVKISGWLIINGGGENSIVLNNTSVSGSLIVLKKDGKIRVVASGNSEISNTILKSGAKLEESKLTGKGFGNIGIIQMTPGQQVTLDGDFDSLNIDTDGVKANISGGTVGTVKIKEGTNGSKLAIGSTASVKNLVANDDVSVTGGSRIQNANINSNGVVLDAKPGNVIIASGITATVAGAITSGAAAANTTPPVVPPATPPTTPPTTPPVGGGDNSGSGGGNNSGGGGTRTNSGSLTVSPGKAVIGFPQSVTLSFTPAVKTKNQTIIFNLPDEIKAVTGTGDIYYNTMLGNVTSLEAENISNSGKTVTLKNIDLTSGSCSLLLYNKKMPTTTQTLTFSVISDDDGDLTAFLPSQPVTASMDIVSHISETLSARDIDVLVGEIAIPDISISPASPFVTLSFSSSNPSIAAVNAKSGVINGVSTGTAVITVTASETGYTDVTTTFNVTVIEDILPTVKVSVDNRNNITLTFSTAVQKFGILFVDVYAVNQAHLANKSIDLAPKPGVVDWESPTVVKIANTAGGLGLDNTNAVIIKVRITSVMDAATGKNLQFSSHTIQGADTKAPQIASINVKAGNTADDDTVTFYFNEAMDNDSIKNLANYVIDGVGAFTTITDAKLKEVASDSMSVSFYVPGINHPGTAVYGKSFTINEVKDRAGNVMSVSYVYPSGTSTFYVVNTAIATDKRTIKIEFNREIGSMDYTGFVAKKADGTVISYGGSGSISATLATIKLYSDLPTDTTGVSVYYTVNAKNCKDLDGNSLTFGGREPTAADVIPGGLIDQIKPEVISVDAGTTPGSIVFKFSEKVKSAGNLTSALKIFTGIDPVALPGTITYMTDDTVTSAAGFNKIIITGLSNVTTYNVWLYTGDITDLSSNANPNVVLSGKEVTTK